MPKKMQTPPTHTHSLSDICRNIESDFPHDDSCQHERGEHGPDGCSKCSCTGFTCMRCVFDRQKQQQQQNP